MANSNDYETGIGWQILALASGHTGRCAPNELVDMVKNVVTLLLLLTSIPAQAQMEFKDPMCGTNAALGEGLASMFHQTAATVTAVTSTLVPHVGAQHTSISTSLVLGWPLQLAFGTVTGEKVLHNRCGDDLVDRFRAHRIVLEPQFIRFLDSPQEGVNNAFGIRPAYRFVYHATDTKWGFGGGVAGEFQLVDDVWQPGVGGELIGQFGDCCAPGYLDLALRYTKFFDAQGHAVALMFGYSYF